jgi:hypothetical protein
MSRITLHTILTAKRPPFSTTKRMSRKLCHEWNDLTFQQRALVFVEAKELLTFIYEHDHHVRATIKNWRLTR